jgi:osmotically-inducible protein OsmY
VDATGTIDVGVEGGIVTLDGDVTGPGQKRLAGVLAWWVPGSRDVINGIGVTPPEQDSEAAITDAVLQVLEKGIHTAGSGDAGWHCAARSGTQARGR